MQLGIGELNRIINAAIMGEERDPLQYYKELANALRVKYQKNPQKNL